MASQVPFEELPLMFITDRHRSKGRDNKAVIRAALEGGIRLIQYREPDLSDAEFYGECLKIKEMCDDVGATLIVNDRFDVAALVRAPGLHLGKGDLPLRVVKEYMGEDFIVGYSAHTLEEAITAAWEGADYITLSPIFRLTHKETPFKPHGIEGAKKVISKIKVPVFLLGGIHLTDLKDLAGTINPLRIAAVSMISEAEDIKAAAEEATGILVSAMMKGRKG
jgi:thiamine-phosphate pyrophosphorylase